MQMTKDTHQPSAKALSWTRYWRSGFQNTCFFADKAFSVEGDWQAYFSTAATGTKIIDLATGNGAVAWIAAAVARDSNRDVAIVGVDFADINPGDVANVDAELLPWVTFVGSTDLTELPFSDAEFDFASSQFGFEYAQESAALLELKRVLKPGGKVRFLIHASEGAVHEASTQRLRRARLMLESGQIIPLLEELAKAATSASAPRVAKIQKRISAKVDLISRKFKQLPADDLVFELCREAKIFIAAVGQVPAIELSARVRHLAEEVRAYTLRLNAMQQAARNAGQMQGLCQSADVLGFTLSNYEAYYIDNQQVGWIFLTHNPR